MKRILLLGGSGQVGYELIRSLAPIAKVIAPVRADFDLSMDEQTLTARLQYYKPELLINAAAYTAVDRAEQETELAWQVNTTAPGLLATVCQSLAIPMIHFSTDYVFDGSQQRPWKETDEAGPLNVYGQSKLSGEQLIRQSQVPHLIFRTSWVYGLRGNNFLNTMRRLAKEKALLQIVNDQKGCPTWSRHIAEAVSAIVALAFHEGKTFWDNNSGTYHLTGTGSTTWFGFAEAIFDELQAMGHPVPVISGIGSEAYKTAAKRPAFSVLDNTLLEQQFGIRLPDWRHSLNLVMQDFQV